MKLYFDLLSEPARAVYIFLKINKIEFEPHPIDLLTAQNRTPEYVKINPFACVPVIDDDGFILTESVAIMRYVAEKYTVADHWFQTETVQKLARVDEFLNWYHTNLRKNAGEILIIKLFSRLDFPGWSNIKYDAKKVKGLQDTLAKTINQIDEYFLKGKPFIAGDEISVADLLAYCELLNQDVVEDDAYKCNENVNAWLKRVAAKLDAEGVLAEHIAAVEKWREMYANAKK